MTRFRRALDHASVSAHGLPNDLVVETDENDESVILLRSGDTVLVVESCSAPEIVAAITAAYDHLNGVTS